MPLKLAANNRWPSKIPVITAYLLKSLIGILGTLLSSLAQSEIVSQRRANLANRQQGD